jgi:hypothetical protein
MKACWGNASALDGGEWSVSRPGRLTHRERVPGTHWTGGGVGPQSRSGCGGEEKNLFIKMRKARGTWRS